jgi:hypothetical protein
MLMGYESFLVDIGMYGNSLGCSYNWYSVLATDNTWFKNVWELLNYFNVKATFGEDFQPHPIWEGDFSLTDLFSRYWKESTHLSPHVPVI